MRAKKFLEPARISCHGAEGPNQNVKPSLKNRFSAEDEHAEEGGANKKVTEKNLSHSDIGSPEWNRTTI